MPQTLRVNLYGGPGTGKSTTAALVFGKLKAANYNAELITEHAKDMVWESSMERLAFQPLTTAEQQWKEQRVEGKVDVLVSDTSGLLGLVYSDFGINFKRWVVEEYKQHWRLNIFLNRSITRAYNPAGRYQTADEASNLDTTIFDLLEDNYVPFSMANIEDDFSHVDKIVETIETVWAKGSNAI